MATAESKLTITSNQTTKTMKKSKSSKIYFTDNREKVEVWKEDVDGKTYYWKKVNGISSSLDEAEYKKEVQKAENFQAQF